MSPRPPLSPPVATVLVVSSRLGTRRGRALSGIAREAAAVEIRATDDVPAPEGFDAIVLDGAADVPPDWVGRVLEHAERGARLVVVGSPPRAGGEGSGGGRLGAGHAPLARAEWIVKVAETTTPPTARLPGEFAVVDRFRPLAVPPDASVVLSVSVGHEDRAALFELAHGRGRITVSGLGDSDSALEDVVLSTVLRRALRSADEGPTPTLGMAVVGYGPFGGMGHHHALAAAATPGLEMVAVCDSSPERRKAAENELPGVRACSGAAEIADDEDVDLVVVATPPVSHASIALSMLRAGKHVACEKPLCLSTSEADQMIAVAEASGVCLTVNHSRRWDGDFVAVRRAVDGGLIGEVFNVETFVGGFEHPCREWHSEVSVSGGTAYDWGSHHLDWILLLMGGPPRTVRATGHKRVWHDVTNLDQLRAHLVWEDGREAQFVHSDVAAVRRPKFYLQGTAGTLVGHYRPVAFEHLEPAIGLVTEQAHHAEAPAVLTLARYESGVGLTETSIPPAPEQRFAFHRNLADHLLGGEALAVTAESARQVVAVLEAAERSAAEGGTLLELDTGR
jgi:predicted dehydrogenase